MNPLHYPSLDRCKKLTSLGFPDTEIRDEIETGEIDYAFDGEDDVPYIITETVLFPSVMEMMDVVPKELNDNGETLSFSIKMGKNGDYAAGFELLYNFLFYKRDASVANALSDLIIWLVENSYLTFKTYD